MKKALFITLKEVRDFLQDKGDLSFSLVLPILIFALMYGAFGGNLQFNGTANVVNEDAGGKYSTLLLQRLDDVKGLTVQTMSASDADSKLSRSSIQMAVFIPQGFSDKLAANQPTQLVFKQRGNGGTEGQIVSSIVRGAAEGIGQNLQLQNQVKSDLSNTNITPQQIQVTVQDLITQEQSSPAVAVTENTLGSNPDPVNQFLPGIMTMFVLFAVNLTAQALVDERRKGTLERLLATRLTVGELFSGKFLAYMARGFIQTTILLLLAYAVFRIFTPVSFLESLVLALLFAAACSAIGLIIGSLAKSQNQATWISVFFTMLMVMISGTFVALTPGTTLETLSHLSINTYANDAFRALITQGGSLADVKTDIFVMLGVAVIGLVISRFLFRATQQGGK
jgi:ABC-2 type transport system permease protein